MADSPNWGGKTHATQDTTSLWLGSVAEDAGLFEFSLGENVRYGSLADIGEWIRDVRFTP